MRNYQIGGDFHGLAKIPKHLHVLAFIKLLGLKKRLISKLGMKEIMSVDNIID